MRLAPSRAISSSVSVISPACTEEVSVDSLSIGGVSFPPPASGVFVCWAHAEGYAALFHPIKSRDPQLLRIPRRAVLENDLRLRYVSCRGVARAKEEERRVRDTSIDEEFCISKDFLVAPRFDSRIAVSPGPTSPELADGTWIERGHCDAIRIFRREIWCNLCMDAA